MIGFTSCMDNPNHPGSEYMPDMGHSIAYEANVLTEYSWNTWDDASIKKGSGHSLIDLSHPGEPVKGTIARGYAGKASGDLNRANTMVVQPNGSVPYYYEDTEAGRANATANLINNPYPITEAGLEQGKELYDIFCGICHGKKMDGAGHLARDGSPYIAAPKSFIIDEMIDASNGRFYHAIMYGLNVMGGYSDKLSYEERWNVIHYIRSVQAGVRDAKYSALSNTLNTGATPGANFKPVATAMSSSSHNHHGETHVEGHDAGHNGNNHGDHSHDAGHEGTGHDMDTHNNDAGHGGAGHNEVNQIQGAVQGATEEGEKKKEKLGKRIKKAVKKVIDKKKNKKDNNDGGH